MVLVTGAGGFVGSAACEGLRARGLRVLPALRKTSQPGQFETGEINEQTDWRGGLAECDAVLHLAARVHVMHDEARDPVAEYWRANVDATMNLARQCADAGVRRFVFVSSIKVNGESTHGRAFTAMDKPAPVDPYGQSKLEAEMQLRTFCGQAGMELVIVRPPLVYGPGVRANFRNLMRLVKTRLPLPLGGMNNRRSMVALDNLVDLLAECITHRAAIGRIFLASDDDDLSTTKLVELIGKSMRKRPLLIKVPVPLVHGLASVVGKGPAVDRLWGSLQVDIAYTKQTLGWSPRVAVPAAIDKTVRHFLETD